MKGIRKGLNLPGRIALSMQLWSLLALAANKPADICASINTSSGQADTWTWQSFGHCGDLCRADDFAFAIVQDHNCWCSDYAPADSTVLDDDECDIKCPGFTEVCGGENAFGYLSLNEKPSGTKDSGGSSPTTVQTVTADGTVRTVTITPTGGVDAPNTADIRAKKKGPNTGTIVGIVIGVALGVIILFAIGCFIKIRRANRRSEGTFEVHSAASTGAGVTGVAPSVSQVKGNGSFMSTRSVAAASSAAGVGNRRSRLMPVDPRMDPNTAPGIYVRNKSHESVHTLHDDQDYSRRVVPPRVLRATNPDSDLED